MTPSEREARAEFPATKAAFDRTRDNLLKHWRMTSQDEAEMRERIYRLMVLLDDVQNELMRAMGQSSEAIDQWAKEFAATKD